MKRGLSAAIRSPSGTRSRTHGSAAVVATTECAVKPTTAIAGPGGGGSTSTRPSAGGNRPRAASSRIAASRCTVRTDDPHRPGPRTNCHCNAVARRSTLRHREPEGARHGSHRTITDEVTTWPGVEAGTGRRGEWSFRVGRREIGHLHGDHAAHFSFPKDVWAELYAAGRIAHHPVFPGREGPAARRIAGDDDVRDVIGLLRLNYDRAVARSRVAG